jgi:hypothetical protein
LDGTASLVHLINTARSKLKSKKTLRQLLVPHSFFTIFYCRLTVHTVPTQIYSHEKNKLTLQIQNCSNCFIISYHIMSYLFTFRRPLQIWNASHSLHKYARHLMPQINFNINLHNL